MDVDVHATIDAVGMLSGAAEHKGPGSPHHGGHDLVQELDDRDLRAQARPHGAQLQADVPPADDDHALRHLLQRDGARGRHDPADVPSSVSVECIQSVRICGLSQHGARPGAGWPCDVHACAACGRHLACFHTTRSGRAWTMHGKPSDNGSRTHLSSSMVMPGSGVTSEPVAMIVFFAFTVDVPPSRRLTSISCGDLNLPHPFMYSTCR